MAQPIKLYICYAPTDTTALSKLVKHLNPLEGSGKIQSWHKGKLVPGDLEAQRILTELNQAQIILMLVSGNFIHSEHYGNYEVTHALKLQQEAGIRVIPVILEDCLWNQTELGELAPLPVGGKPVGKDGRALVNVAIRIGDFVKQMQAEQDEKEAIPPASSTVTRAKARKPARTKTKEQPRSGTVLAVKTPRSTRTPHPTQSNVLQKNETVNSELLSSAEPEPVTPEPVTSEARTSAPSYDQNYEKLQREINQIVFEILIWEPHHSAQTIVADERRAIYQSLTDLQHQCWLGTQLPVPSGMSLQDREIEQASKADMTVLLVEVPAISQMYEFCSDYDDTILKKTFFFYPEEEKSPDESAELDEMLAYGFKLQYYEEDDITHCKIRAKVLKWVKFQRGCRYRMQRRRGR